MKKILPALLALAFVLSASLEAAAQQQPPAKPAGANTFNRLLKTKAGAANLAPPVDGIHDPQNVATHSLQPPAEAFATLPAATGGNRIDWVKALQGGLIEPRSDRIDEKAEQLVLDLDIIREVKGSMPDVVYPHRQHTEWLDCSNCHTDIFIPQKGANPITMGAILSGQYCGVCHGKVAFPVANCQKCHSKTKAPDQALKAQPTKYESYAEATAKSKQQSEADLAKTWSLADLMNRGKSLYINACSGCHGETGEGVPGTFPPLKASKVVGGPLDEHIKIVLNGRPNTAMLGMRNEYTDTDLAAIITYERNMWGNKGDLVQPKMVNTVRQK